MSGTGQMAVQQSAGLQVRRKGPFLGAEITGVDLRRPLDPATVQAIREAHAAYQVLAFPGQDLTGEELRAFGRQFGELSVHPFSTNAADTPDLIIFDNHPGNPPLNTDVWHSDETFRAEPPMGTVLNSKEIPELGGDTVFASMAAAYEGLSDRMQHLISGLEAVHDFKPFKQTFGHTPEERERLQHFERQYPPQVHPVVRVHPLTGRKVLFVNPQFTISIKGMEERESRALLDTLFHQALIPEYQYRHCWENDMVVFWDNISTQHYAVHDYYPHRRRLNRVTIKGGPVQGVEPADPASLRRYKIPPPGDGSAMIKRQHQREG